MIQRTRRCPNCGHQRVATAVTKSLPGKHYHCNSCGHEWQSRTVRRYRQRQIHTRTLLEAILKLKVRLNLQDRFFVEKVPQRRTGQKHRARLLRIAHKIGLDLRDKE